MMGRLCRLKQTPGLRCWVCPQPQVGSMGHRGRHQREADRRGRGHRGRGHRDREILRMHLLAGGTGV